ncbi:MAG TPA: DUF4383 domain-containing protein [Blastocatellia bacterium]|nr:DUF4383 domain-containing protein [Blastocatellia bacterium]
MAKTVATLLGIVLIIVGIAGFFRTDLLGAHLGKAHNGIHIVTGVLSFYFGMKGASAAKSFCIAFGIIYALLGVVGYFVGTGPEHMLELPKLMLGTRDHIIHIAVAVLYLIGGITTKTAASAPAA